MFSFYHIIQGYNQCTIVRHQKSAKITQLTYTLLRSTHKNCATAKCEVIWEDFTVHNIMGYTGWWTNAMRMLTTMHSARSLDSEFILPNLEAQCTKTMHAMIWFRHGITVHREINNLLKLFVLFVMCLATLHSPLMPLTSSCTITSCLYFQSILCCWRW